MVTMLHLVRLKFIRLKFICQLDNRLMSVWKDEMSSWVDISEYITASSANSLILELIWHVMSLM